MSGLQNPRVTQGDREAAAAFWVAYCGDNILAWPSLSSAAQRETIEAFARHREAAEAITTAQAEIEALRARVADALAWLRDHIKEVDDDNSYWGGPHKRAYLGAPAILKELTARVALTKEPDA